MDKLAISARGKSVNRKSPVNISISWVMTTALTASVLTIDLPSETTGLLVVALILSLMFCGIPIGLAMIGGSSVGLIGLTGFGSLEGMFSELVYSSTASWSMSVIPLFILMGIALWKSGITAKAFAGLTQWVGKMPGGLAISTNFSGALLAASSGSSIGISYALGRMAIPEMLRAGYKPSLATGTVAVAGTLGQMIPPSILLVVYAGVAQTPVGPQLLASIVPGILLALAYALVILIHALASKSAAPAVVVEGVTWATRFRAIASMSPLIAIVVIVIGGLFVGIFTPTEAGAVGAVSAVLAGLFTSKENRRGGGFKRYIGDTLSETVVATVGVFTMLIGVAFLTRILAVSRLTNAITEFVINANLNVFVFLLILVAVFLLLGMFVDALAIILLTVPILIEPLAVYGIDPIWFGVFIVLLCEIGVVSPPVGILSFIVHQLSQNPNVNLGHTISLGDVFRGVLPFIGAALCLVLILIPFPEIALWLPGISAQ